MDALPPGHRIGSYEIVRVAGRGAVGVVYEAQHTFTLKKVAIKTLNRHFASEAEFRARFDREAEGAALVDHPNITTVFDAGEHDGVPYLVMTYVEGPDLERILEQRDAPMEPAEAVLICTAVAQALDAAAGEGLAHRDVKPANILLEGWDASRGGGLRPRIYLTDFGLTKHNAAATVTRTGQFVGTLLYMAPEQIEGKAVAASDQYSLACVLWECLVGKPPFLPSGGSNLSLLTAHLSDPIPLVSAASHGRLPHALDEVFQRGMAKKASDRFASCTAMMDAAARALGLGAVAPEPSAPVAAPAQQPRSVPPTASTSAPPSAPPSDTPPATAPPPGSGGGRGATAPSGLPAGLSRTPGSSPGGGDRPPGLPAGLPASAYQPSRTEGSRTWLWILLAVVALGVAIAVGVLATAGDASAAALGGVLVPHTNRTAGHLCPRPGRGQAAPTSGRSSRG